MLVIAILSFANNFGQGRGLLPLFWKLAASGLLMMLLSQVYWIYFDSARRHGEPSPVPGDSFFLLAHVFFLFALALRPHSISAGRDLRIRRLDFALLTLWWFSLYGYFSLPWQFVIGRLRKIQSRVLFSFFRPTSCPGPGSWHLVSAKQRFLAAFLFASPGCFCPHRWRQFASQYFYRQGFLLFGAVFWTLRSCSPLSGLRSPGAMAGR